MKRLAILLGILLLGLPDLALSARTCGTAQLIEHFRQQRNASRTKNIPDRKISARTTSPGCTVDDYFDVVYTKKTEHFEIFYTLDGPHKTTTNYVDSLGTALEYAWKFHVTQSGMLPPLGIRRTTHYQKEVEPGLYPVEVVDIAQSRDYGQLCSQCFGMTIPDDSSRSNLMIENDFYYAPAYPSIKDTVKYNGKSCTYQRATESLENPAYNYPYATQWVNGLRVTAVHELYHAVQLRYLDYQEHDTFWFEASASGIEEVATPDIDDYFLYLPQMANTVGTPLDKGESDYGSGIFLLYLYNHVGRDTDKRIWENFANYPDKPFQYQLKKVAASRKLSADSLFHDFAIRLSFTGDRSSMVDSSYWIDDDQPRWPEFRTVSEEGIFDPFDLDTLSYRFYSNGEPDLSTFKGRASAVNIRKDSYSVHFLPTTNSIKSFLQENSQAAPDSVIWILSRFVETELIPATQDADFDSTLRAYPVPWRHGNLCFTPLPLDKEHIEIRNRRGNLVEKIKYDRSTICLSEDKVKSLFAPGVYRFRVGNSGKTKNFIVVY